MVHMEFPPIMNSQPAHRYLQSPTLNTTVNAPFRSQVEVELDSIINETLINFKNQKINKIIFTTPISPRLGKTYYK